MDNRFEIGEKVTIPGAAIEFVVHGNTIWVQSEDGTVLRLKCTGRINIDRCWDSPVSHTDMVVEGDIDFCLSGDAY
jgi:hypothetical protein